MFAETFPRSLVVLRQLNMSFYLELMRSHYDDETSYDAGRELIAELSSREASADREAVPDLTDLLASREYRTFVQLLNETDSDAAAKAQRILETKEYEQRLSRLKDGQFEAYLDELRVVTESELVSALENGTIVNSYDDDGLPMPIRSDENYSGAFVDRPTATAWVDATLLTTVLNRFASAGSEATANAQGLRLRQVVIDGALNLNWLDCPFPLGFEGCHLRSWISADYLHVPWLSFDSCDFESGAFNAASIVVEHDLRFWDCRGLRQLFLPDARIGSFSPTNPTSRKKLTESETQRTVIDGATFGQLFIPAVDGNEIRLEISRSVRIETVKIPGDETPAAVAAHVFEWLTRSETAAKALQPDVWMQVEGALRRSNFSAAATEFGVKAADHMTRRQGFGGLVKRIVLRNTVRYFYDNMRALWFLLGLFIAAWIAVLCIALFAPDQLVQSPLANEALVPQGWLVTVADKIVWSFLYAIDLVLAPISLGLASTIWPVSIWLSLFFAVIKGVSILLLGLFVVGVTGLVEKRARA